jgi:hypothetical protein
VMASPASTQPMPGLSERAPRCIRRVGGCRWWVSGLGGRVKRPVPNQVVLEPKWSWIRREGGDLMGTYVSYKYGSVDA